MTVFLSKLPNSDRLYVPDNADRLSSTNDLLDRMGLVYKTNSGFYMLSPIVQMVQDRLESIAHDAAAKHDFQPVGLPFMVSPHLLAQSGKEKEYGHEFYRTTQNKRDYLFSPTTEESIISYLKDGGLRSYRQMPMRFVHPHHVFRHIKRPEGIFKSRDFRAFLLSSFDADDAGYQKSLHHFSTICDELFDKAGIEVYKLSSEDNKIMEYLFACDIGDRPLEKGVIANRNQKIAGDTLRILPHDISYGNIAMGYEFNRVANFGLTYSTPDGRSKTPIMGTFGIGIQRCVYALFQKARNGCSDAFNHHTRPFDIMLMPVGPDSEVLKDALEHHSRMLQKTGLRVAVDDRSAPLSRKFSLADFFSVPLRIPISLKDIEKDEIELRSGLSKQSTKVSADKICHTAHKILTPTLLP